MNNYTLTLRRRIPSAKPDMLLAFTPEATLTEIERGAALAAALGGRFARGPVGYYLSPAAGRKWQALFDAGFSAYRCFRSGEHVWRYGRSDTECKRLPDAVSGARAVGVGS